MRSQKILGRGTHKACLDLNSGGYIYKSGDGVRDYSDGGSVTTRVTKLRYGDLDHSATS